MDGTAPAITPKWVDRYVGRTGFADAMIKARWISFSDDGVTFPAFERHNGESAKRRGEAAIRQRLSRKNRDDGVTGVARTAIPRPFVRHVMERDGYMCVYCGQQSSPSVESSRKAVLGVDHITPITRGGSSSVENLACCCRLCNNEKNDRTPEEWGLLPTFMQIGVSYLNGQIVTDASQKNSDTCVTREEKRREEKKDQKPPIVPHPGDASAAATDHAAILDSYHATLPACQRIEVLNPKRRKRLAAAVKLAKQVCASQGWEYVPDQFWPAYWTQCAADKWMRGEVPNPNNPAWKQNLDVLLAEDRFAGVMDKAIAAMRGDA